MRTIGFSLIIALVLALGRGRPQAAQSLSRPATAETVARLHWLGKKHLAGDTNAVYLMSIWNLPESTKLEAQALSKLAAWLEGPGKLSAAKPQTPNPDHAGRLRSFVKDLLQEESYLEIRGDANQRGEWALAVRLNELQARYWEANHSLFQAALGAGGGEVSLSRAGAWTILAGTRAPAANAQPANASAPSPVKNQVLADLLARVNSHPNGTPFVSHGATNYWLEADLDLPKISSTLGWGWRLPSEMPKISYAVIGDGQNVRSRGHLNFPKPLAAELEPWNLPTNLIRGPLQSFGVVRGLKPWLSSSKTWTDLKLGVPPNQVCYWAEQGLPFQSYAAVPLPNAGSFVRQTTDRLVHAGNAWVATNSMGKFVASTNFTGVLWTDFPFLSPFLRWSPQGNGHDFVWGGLAPNSNSGPMPPGLLQEVLAKPNLVAYDWELTTSRIEAWVYIGQICRVLFHKPQLPFQGDCINWLRATGFKQGNCVTEITRTGPSQLSFVRKSSAGFSGAELQLLSDWLESPQFPHGLHTLLAPPDMPPRRNIAAGGVARGTNAPNLLKR